MYCAVVPEVWGPYVVGKRLYGAAKSHVNEQGILVLCNQRAISGVVDFDTDRGTVTRYIEGPNHGEVLFDITTEQFLTEELSGNVEAYALVYKRGLTL